MAGMLVWLGQYQSPQLLINTTPRSDLRLQSEDCTGRTTAGA